MRSTRPSVSNTPLRSEPRETRFSKSNRPKPRRKPNISRVSVSPNRYVLLSSIENVLWRLQIPFHDHSVSLCLSLSLFAVILFPLQRKAIVDGLRSSIVDFAGHVEGSSTKEVMDLLLLTQYFDMIRDVGAAGHCKTTFVPTSKGPADETRMALLQSSGN